MVNRQGLHQIFHDPRISLAGALGYRIYTKLSSEKLAHFRYMS